MNASVAERMRTVGVVVNHDKPDAHAVLASVLGELRRAGCRMRGTEDAVQSVSPRDRADITVGEWSSADWAIVIGGDGTLLSAARRLAGSGTPILGVHLGGLGFLSEVAVQDAADAVQRVLTGAYTIDERTMVRTRIVDAADRERHTGVALNDAVVIRSDAARTVRLSVWIGDEEMGTFPADGVIVSTPTGSTAYALSSGGPLVLPALHALTVTPICPHTLSLRPVVAPDTTTIRLQIAGHTPARLSLDGQCDVDLEPGERVIVTRADERTRLIRLSSRSPLGVARLRLGWGARAS